MSAEVRRQEKLDRIEERDFRREKLPGKYTVRILDGIMENLRKNI